MSRDFVRATRPQILVVDILQQEPISAYFYSLDSAF